MILESRHPIPEILSHQPLFLGLSKEELHELAVGTSEFRVHRNEVLFHKGDRPRGMHIVVTGQVKLFIPTAQGWDKVVHMESAGASFGEAVMLLDKPYPVSAQATQDSVVLLVSREVMAHAIDNSSALCRKMLSSLSVRLHELLGDMETCTLRSSTQRVICFLSQQAPHDAQRYAVQLEASKQTIASQLNLAPETFSRVLSNLTHAGLIHVKGRTITVLDHIGLRNYNG
jgi:CRP-like cAMP-binding protein